MATGNKKAYYQKIYDDLLNEIQSGGYGDGKRLPTEKELAERYDVSIITSRSALKLLAENGFITRTPKKGSFVRTDGLGGQLPAGGEAKEVKPTIGLLLTDFDENYATGLLSSIEREASRRDVPMIFHRSYESQEMEEKALMKLVEQGAEGFIIMPVHGKHYNHQILRLVLDKVPIVIMDRQLKGIDASFVGTNNTEAARKATDYLIGLGHSKIAFISPPIKDTSTLEERLDGFVKSHMEHNIPIDLSGNIETIASTTPGNKNSEAIREDIEKIRALLAGNPQITCLFAAEYCIALIALRAVESLGKKVPDDISILCFDGPSNSVGDYFFTHVRQKEEEIGAQTVNLLMKQFDDIEDKQHLYLDTELITGKSTRRI